MRKSYWFMICGLIFMIQAMIFAIYGNQLMIGQLGMAAWMCYKGILEAGREMRRARWIRKAKKEGLPNGV